MFCGLFYWFPKITGKMYSEALGRISAVLVFIGFNATFLPQFIMGSLGMPRRYATYDGIYSAYHVTSTIGSWILALGFGVAIYALIKGALSGEKAESDPWNGTTLEWTIPSPPIHTNFETTPKVTGRPYEYR